jgi:peptidoglycan hydrolase CwlO-like protein
MTKIDEMIASYSDKVSTLNVSISTIDEQLTDIQEQQTALNDVLNQVKSEQDNLLINKRDANN